jgi:vacuolar-type H+-ATPase subunit H
MSSSPRSIGKLFEDIALASMTTARHHMQKDIEQEDDATTRASKSYDKSMNDKREDARRMAEQLIAEEERSAPNSALRAYVIAVAVGLAFWAMIYFIWLSL